MFKPIKFPFGPSASGAAGVRALDSVGGNWQQKQGPGFTSKLMGDFRRVETGGFEYITSGRTRAASLDPTSFVCVRYQIPFIPNAAQPPNVSLGRGLYFRYAASPLEPGTSAPYTYAVTPSVDFLYYSRPFNRTIEGRYSGFFGGNSPRGTFDISFSEPSDPFAPTPGGDGLRIVVPNALFVQEVTGPPADRIVFSVCTLMNGRTDIAGRELEDLAVLVWPRVETPYGFTIPATAFTRANAEFFSIAPAVVTQNFAAFLVLEKFFVAQPAASSAGLQPKAWLFRAPGKDFDALAVSEVTASLFDRAYYPDPIPVGSPPVSAYVPNSIPNIANAYSANTLALASVCALPGNVMLLAYQILRVRPGMVVSDPDSLRWYSRIARIGLSPVSVTVTQNEELPLPINVNRLPNRYIQSMVHLGAGFVLAKKVYGFDGVNFDTNFLRSTDGGVTWSEFDPAGFNAPLLNQNFGDFTVHRPRTGLDPEDAGIVLVIAWDAVDLAYFVYESRDDGSTWTRKAKVVKPDTFYRVDTMLQGDGGGNFRQLLPGPDPLRAVDLTMPDRYNP